MKFFTKILILIMLVFTILEARSFRSSSSTSSRSSSFRSSTSTRSSSSTRISSPSRSSTTTIKAVRPSTTTHKSMPKVNTVKSTNKTIKTNVNNTNKNNIINNTTIVNKNESRSSNDGFVNGLIIGNMLNRPSTQTVVVSPTSSAVVREHEVIQEDDIYYKKSPSVFEILLGIMAFLIIIFIGIFIFL